MADTSDVEAALVTLAGSILYPGGVSAVGIPMRIYRGAPASAQLDTDLAAGVAHLTVFSAPGFSRTTGGYLDGPVTTPGVVTLTATVSGAAVTFGGTAGLGQLAGVIVNGLPYTYACQATDTPSTVAAAIASRVSGASAAGPVVTFATTRPVIARTGGTGTSRTALRWQTQAFRLITWAPTPAARDTICSFLDAGLSGTPFVSLPDGQSGRLFWHNTTSDDVPQKEQLWKRDLLYTVQFATTQTVNAAQVLFGILAATAQTSAGITISGPVQTAS